MKVKLYIEGGGDSRSLHIKCREGFRKLFERAGFVGRMPGTKACGSRNDAYGDFRTALSLASVDDYPILLVDSEAPVSQPPWDHLQQRDAWGRPTGAEDAQAQLMVQCMETWCIADRGALRIFFGQDLAERRLPHLEGLEARSKDDVQDALVDATRRCGRNRAYAKGSRSFELLGILDSAKLRERLPHFARLCKVLDEKLGA